MTRHTFPSFACTLGVFVPVLSQLAQSLVPQSWRSKTLARIGSWLKAPKWRFPSMQPPGMEIFANSPSPQLCLGTMTRPELPR
ncbi:hypothetical protein C9890_0548 [Perkinsus sp. BL_2016]|nr:hypothetical protein C9890_0548 [Perkinsus sp. BL_2016]